VVLRFWIERGDPATLRARITHTRDINLPSRTSVASGSVAEICAAVRDCVEAAVNPPTEDDVAAP
jgi:hypothetical protein